ncbi:MAG: hypothetical protein N7Q72_06650, partial [Spiroplasma sp. Tabriz.8]|nr:hypothetical protein [Spiroplasma sp. Tabriz.8]
KLIVINLIKKIQMAFEFLWFFSLKNHFIWINEFNFQYQNIYIYIYIYIYFLAFIQKIITINKLFSFLKE